MKQLLISFLALLIAFPGVAKLDGNGYYRVQNYKTKRYAYLTDNTGEMNTAATTFDVGAILMFSDFLKAASDPATVIYVNNISGKQYALEAQGTSTKDFVEVSLYIEPAPSNRDTYACYGVKGGMRKYLADINISSSAQGEASVEGTGEDREWYFHPIGTADNNYFGVKPTVTVGTKYYYPLYGDFPISAYSAGVKLYTISRIEGAFAILKEINGTVPASTPVLVECEHPLAIDNKLTVGGSGTSVGTNLLGGVYFDNDLKTHWNRTKYDRSKMRVLGVDSKGNLAFVEGNIDYLPANQSYLKVNANTPSELRIVTEAEYEILRYEPTRITVAPSSTSAVAGDTKQFTTTLTPGDAKTTITWSSSNQSVATVDSNGLATCVAAGTTTITATTDNGLSASATLKVYPVVESVSISNTELTLAEGDTYKLTASVVPADAFYTGITWSSSNTAVATVDKDGTVTAIAPGTATITAKNDSGKSATCKVTVNKLIIAATGIELSSPSAKMVVGETLSLSANVMPANTTDKTVAWSSDNESVATVDNDGLVTAVWVGSANITATCGSVSANCAITVERGYVEVTSVTLNQNTLTIKEGERATLTATVNPDDATEKKVTWSSDNEAVATVNEIGMVKGIKAGIANITATAGNCSTGCTVTVLAPEVPVVLPNGVTILPAFVELKRGETAQLNATVTPASADDKTLTWTSSNEAVATVDANGLVTGTGNGTATITATTVNGLTASSMASVTIVLEGITLTPEEYTAVEGAEFDLTVAPVPADAVLPGVVWKSTDTSVVSVNNQGHCVVKKEGVAEITAKAGGFEAKCIVTGTSGVRAILGNAATADVYTLEGVKIAEDADADTLSKLPSGLYIVNGRKVVK